MNHKIMLPMLAAALLVAVGSMRAAITEDNDDFALGKVVAQNKEALDRMDYMVPVATSHLQKLDAGSKIIVKRSDKTYTYGIVLFVAAGSVQAVVGHDRTDNKLTIKNVPADSTYLHASWLSCRLSQKASATTTLNELIRTVSPTQPELRQYLHEVTDQPPSYEEVTRQAPSRPVSPTRRGSPAE